MPDEWVGLVNTTAPKYLKGASDETMRGRLMLAMLKKRSRFEYNQSGTEMRWDIEYSQPDVQAWGGSGAMSFENHNAHLQLQMPWRGYVAKDAMPKIDQLKNKGNEAIVNVFQTKMNRLTKAVKDNLGGEFFKDGSATGRENAIHGVETFTAAGTTVVADIMGKPDDSYGGYDTDLGVNGGSWSADLATSPNASVAKDWPLGRGDSEFDCLAPKLINWSSNNWGTSSVLWENNCWRAISFGIMVLRTTGGSDGKANYCPMDPNLFQGFKNFLETKQRELMPHKEATDLGFGEVLNMDGVAINPEFDCPANTFYLFNMSQITVSLLTPELLWMEGPDKDPRSGWGHLFGVGMFGNIKWRPKHVAKGKNYAAS